MNKTFYVTTAIPYVNSSPHIGHALEFVQTDAIARYHRLMGQKTFSLTGSDENALKNVQAAEKSNEDTKSFVDRNAKLFHQLTNTLKTEFNVFKKGTDPDHFRSSQKLWQLCKNKGDIYKKDYTGMYCLGCEAFYTEDELANGECPEHPGRRLEKVSESNYFFRLSRYQKQLINIISRNELEIVPVERKKEVIKFLDKPLQDISISRSNKRARNWGVPVPDDNSQRIYVWFDALNIYRSGAPENVWPADLHVIGKGILRFHAIYWPAFLLSAGIPLPKKIFVHGYLTVNGQKISKTIGNIIDPNQVISKYGVDATRYYLLKEIPPHGDGDFSFQRLEEIYLSDLANELGNLLSRLSQLGEKYGIENRKKRDEPPEEIVSFMTNYRFNEALESIWKKVKNLNRKIDEFAPWKNNVNRIEFLTESVCELNRIGYLLIPFLTGTAKKIISSTEGKIKKAQPLFPKKT